MQLDFLKIKSTKRGPKWSFLNHNSSKNSANRGFHSQTFNCGQRMALLGPVDIYEVKRSQRHLLATFENNRLGSPIGPINSLFHIFFRDNA